MTDGTASRLAAARVLDAVLHRAVRPSPSLAALALPSPRMRGEGGEAG